MLFRVVWFVDFVFFQGPAPRLRRGTEEAHARSAINKRSQSPPPAASTSAYLDVELDLDFDESARRSNTGRRAAVVFSPRDAAVLKETAKEAAASRESDSLQRSGHVAIPGTRAEQPPVSSSPPTSARDLSASPRADAPAEVSSPTLERNADEEGPVSSPPGRPLRPHGRYEWNYEYFVDTNFTFPFLLLSPGELVWLNLLLRPLLRKSRSVDPRLLLLFQRRVLLVLL